MKCEKFRKNVVEGTKQNQSKFYTLISTICKSQSSDTTDHFAHEWLNQQNHYSNNSVLLDQGNFNDLNVIIGHCRTNQGHSPM